MKINEKELVKNSKHVFAVTQTTEMAVIITALQEYSAQCRKKFLRSLRKRITAHHDSS